MLYVEGNEFKSDVIKSAIADADTDDYIFIGGSNFIVGEALIYFRN